MIKIFLVFSVLVLVSFSYYQAMNMISRGLEAIYLSNVGFGMAFIGGFIGMCQSLENAHTVTEKLEKNPNIGFGETLPIFMGIFIGQTALSSFYPLSFPYYIYTTTKKITDTNSTTSTHSFVNTH